MERHSQTAGNHPAARQPAHQPQQRMHHPQVEAEPPPYGSQAAQVVGACAPHLIYMSHCLLRQAVEPHPLPFERKDVDIHPSLAAGAVVASLLFEEAAAVAHLGIAEEVGRVGVRSLQRHVGGQFRGQHLHEPQIVGAHHLDVEIVVPGDEAVVAQRPYQCAAAEPVAYAVALADAVYLQEQLQHTQLLAAQQRAVGIEPAAQRFVVDIIVCHSQSFSVPSEPPSASSEPPVRSCVPAL